MQVRYVSNDFSRQQLILYLSQRELPFVAEIRDSSARSIEQNKLQHMWFNEIAAQTGETATEVQARCKLTIGIPVLREENERFRKAYDDLLKPLDYEAKLRLITDLDLPVTRAMTMKQFSTYLDRVFVHHTGKGFELTQPEIAEWR